MPSWKHRSETTEDHRISVEASKIHQREGLPRVLARMVAAGGGNVWSRPVEPPPVRCVWCKEETDRFIDGVAVCAPCERWSRR